MTTQPVPQTAPARGTITRSLLAVALLVLAGLIIFVGLTRSTSQPTLVYVSALLPVAAAGLLYVRRSIGAAIAVLAALLGALYGFLLSVCILCAPPPLSPEAIAIFVTAAVIYALALLELRTLGLVWVGLAVPVTILALSGNQVFIIVGIVMVAALVAWVILRRRRSGSEPTTDGP